MPPSPQNSIVLMFFLIQALFDKSRYLDPRPKEVGLLKIITFRCMRGDRDVTFWPFLALLAHRG